jgi:glucose-1-phosphate cytidylyltransferase
MVVDKEIFKLNNDSDDILEKDVLSKLANNKLLNAFKHNGVWQSMDTVRDKEILENLISQDKTLWIQKKRLIMQRTDFSLFVFPLLTDQSD